MQKWKANENFIQWIDFLWIYFSLFTLLADSLLSLKTAYVYLKK